MASSLDEFNFPLKTIYKIVKSVLPSKTQLSSEAKKALSRCAAIYVLQVSSTAQYNYKTSQLNAQMIIETIVNMGFQQFRQPLNQFLREFNQTSDPKPKRQRNRKRTHKKSVEQKESIESTESVVKDMKPIQTLIECKTEINTEYDQKHE